MRSSQLDLGKYDSDKIDNHYLEWYDPILAPFLEKKIALLELGVLKGGSLLLWRDYFPQATIAGIDINPPKDFQSAEHIHIFEGSQADPQFLSRVANEIAPEGFDIIIDDASHISELTKVAFWHLFDNHLKPNGLYVIEDWGTGYWDDWPDGKTVQPATWKSRLVNRISSFLLHRNRIPFPSHDFGMVGLVKQLVDEQGAADLTRANFSGKSKRLSKFESMTITPSIIFISKR